MKKLMKKYSFAVLSVTVIGLFFILTGGVHDGNSIELSPPTIVFHYPESSTLVEVGIREPVKIRIDDIDPGKYMVIEKCDFGSGTPTITKNSFSDPFPEYTIELHQGGTNLAFIPSTSITNSGVKPNLEINFSYTFNQPGTYQFVVKARTVTFTDETYKNGVKDPETGIKVYSAYSTVSQTVNVTGTPILPIKRYYFDHLLVDPAPGDPNPQKNFVFTDTSRQYLEILSATKANLKFYWTPPPADTIAYPNLASVYEFNITNADYSVVDEDGNPATAGYNLTLNYEGQSVNFNHEAAPERKIAFNKPSKTIAGREDVFMIFFK